MTKAEISRAIVRGDPIAWNGLTLFPILVQDFEKFESAKPGITLSQKTLPAKFAGMRYLEALFALDMENLQHGEPPVGLFARAIRFLTLALRLPEEKRADGSVASPLEIQVSEEDPTKLAAVLVHMGEQVITITSRDFAKLRPLLAQQNGLELPDEAHNVELEAAERDLEAAGGLNLDVNFEDLIYSVAVQSGVDVGHVFGWTIRKFHKVKAAIDRGLGYQLAYLATASGAKYKNGNPWPSWMFDRKKGFSKALIPMASFQKQMNGTVEAK